MKRQRGFTILELMVVIAVTAILVIVGLPSLQTMIMNNRLTTQLNLLSSSLALARSEAVKVNQRTVVCPSTNGTSCDTAQRFDAGWITFIDRNADFDVDDDSGGNPADDPCGLNAGDDAADDCILSYVAGVPTANFNLQSDIAGNAISYNGLGASNTTARFIICDERGDESAKAIVISTTGRASVRTANTDGTPLTCFAIP